MINRIDPSKNNIRQVDFPLGRSDDENPTTPQARIKRWQENLLDLTLRNRLLNLKDGKQMIPFQCPDVPELVNLLACGKNMRVISLDHSLEKENRLGDHESAQDLRETDPDKYKEFARQYLKENKICVSQLTKEEMIARLTTLFRKAKSDVAERGTNTLFLAAGFLYWKEKPTDSRTIRSPLLLLPVKLTRQRATEIFHLQHHEDDVRINLTLLKRLRQDFDIQVPALEGELTTDHKGLDVEQIFRLMSDAISAAPTMKMIEESALSIFFFAKYLMWKDLVDRTDSLRQNRFVKHLINTPGERYRSTNINNMPEPSEMDKRYRPGDLVTPLPADSSQLAAIASAGDGHDMVIIGPPGTGKSQTIANMIAHCLAKKKTVLFVAEKLAALDVVHRRLKAHNLGDFCLELHSNKADRRSVLKQLEAAWDRAAPDNAQKWVEVTDELQTKRKELNAYVERLHEPGTHGYSVFRAIGIVSDDTSGAGKPAFELEFPALDTHDKESFKNLLEEVKKLSGAFSGIRSLNGLESITRSDWSNVWQQGLLKDADSLHKATAELHRVANDLASSFGQQIQNEISFEQLEHLCRFAEAFEQLEHLCRFAEAFEQLEHLCRFAETTGRISRENYPLEVYENLDQLHTGLNDLEARISAVRHAEGNLSAHYAYNKILQIPISELDQSWRGHSAKFWPFSWFEKTARKRRIAKILQSYTKKGKADPGRDLELLASIASQLKEIKNSDLHELPQFRGIDTNIEDLRTYLDNASQFRDAIDDLKQTLTDTATLIERIESLLAGIESLLAEGGCREDIAEQATALIGSRKEYDAAWRAYCETAGGKPQSTTLKLLQNEISNIVESVQENPKIISDWCRWIAAQTQIDERRQRAMKADYRVSRHRRAMAEHDGLRQLTKALITGSLEPEHAETAFLKAYFSWWLPLAIDSKSELRKFALWEHMHRIKKFRDLTTHWEELAPDQVRRATTHNVPHKDWGVKKNSELGRLRHQLRLKRPSKSIRNLISEMPTEFPRLVPCILMSPLSIAQYLPTQALFDLVIFDEASQITTWDAIGAISRGRQSIIVGDPKQLPPTNFFERATDEEDEDIEEYEQDEESILDEASTAGLPRVDLKWHYRSREEALIAFSNHRYYKDSLITFPSPRRDVKAVQFHKIDGVYRRGTSRTNDEEARAIVKLIIERLERGLKISQDERTTIGVVTFNMQQRDLILDLLDNERLRNPALEWYFDDDREEPLIVKNLETIQGDERDVLMFSVTFGPDKAGKVSMNFGALNKDGGEKRLNVAVTRARQELHVFTSIIADKIDLSRTKAIGVRDLKNFLDYAKRGPNALPARDEGSMGDAESPFETAVEDALKEKGWEVRNQIGVAGYRIDLGILDPDSSGAYLAGIECDGAIYHSSKVARDRDQIRESVLRKLGWKILRIWSTDWYLDPRGSCKQMHEKLNRILDVSRVNNADANRVQSGYDESCLDEDDEILTSNGSSDDSSVNSFDSDSSVNNADVNRVQSGYDESCLDENDETLTSNGSSDGSSVNSFDSDSSDHDLSGDNLSGQPPFTETADRKDVLKDSTEVLDPEQFFTPTYTPVLESLVTGIVKSESPILADSLVRAVANKHGWKRAIRRIRERVFACLGNVEVKNEGDRRFLWWPGTFAESVPYRGRQGRDLRDISQSEIAGLIDKNPECLHAEDPVRELANLLEVSRLTGVTRNYLHECISRFKHQN